MSCIYGVVLANLLILLGVIAIVKIPKHVLQLKNTKVVNFISYLLAGALSLVVGKYLLVNYYTFTNILSISFFILAFITIIYKGSVKV